MFCFGQKQGAFEERRRRNALMTRVDIPVTVQAADRGSDATM